MKPSILDNRERCYLTRARKNLERHHIFFGSGLRKISDDNGFWVYLTAESHRGTCGVHGMNGRQADLLLKMECQLAYERTHSREEFMKLIGRNYLED